MKHFSIKLSKCIRTALKLLFVFVKYIMLGGWILLCEIKCRLLTFLISASIDCVSLGLGLDKINCCQFWVGYVQKILTRSPLYCPQKCYNVSIKPIIYTPNMLSQMIYISCHSPVISFILFIIGSFINIYWEGRAFSV